MHRKSEGFGIAGHKNTYKTGVRCGNWVEDKIGMDMVRSGHSNPSHFVSEAQAHYIQPKDMDDKNVRMCPPTSHVDAAGGLPAHLLFAHGLEPHNPRAGEESRLKSMTQALYGESKVSSTEVLADHPSQHTLEALKKKSNERSRAVQKAAAREAKVRWFQFQSASAMQWQ